MRMSHLGSHEVLPARAADLLVVVTAFAAWDEIVTHRNRSAATATIVDLAVRSAVKDR